MKNKKIMETAFENLELAWKHWYDVTDVSSKEFDAQMQLIALCREIVDCEG